MAGGITSVIQGGQFQSGFLSAGFSEFAGPKLDKLILENVGEDTIGIMGGISRGAVGGAASVLGGGKFANGAITSAFQYMYNFRKHDGTFNRPFTLDDAMDQWRNGEGLHVTDVKASEVDLSGAVYQKLDGRDYNIYTFGRTKTGSIYGTLRGRLSEDGKTMSFIHDKYDFDWHPVLEQRSVPGMAYTLMRNLATFGGAMVNWAATNSLHNLSGYNLTGTPYNIYFTGSIPAPKDLPK